eukprot:snap_masked-scaffold_4-processed-gene-4.33-mRNA-1 protein AED:1.00 eAED:1.00 QI:0/-1/0/0/-1/1/1/0/68
MHSVTDLNSQFLLQVPSGQDEQSKLSIPSPSAERYVPGGQTLTATVPSAGQLVPGGHLRHEVVWMVGA